MHTLGKKYDSLFLLILCIMDNYDVHLRHNFKIESFNPRQIAIAQRVIQMINKFEKSDKETFWRYINQMSELAEVEDKVVTKLISYEAKMQRRADEMSRVGKDAKGKDLRAIIKHRKEKDPNYVYPGRVSKARKRTYITVGSSKKKNKKGDKL